MACITLYCINCQDQINAMVIHYRINVDNRWLHMYFFQMSEEYKFVSSVLDYVSLHCGSVGKSSSNSPRLKSGLFKRSLDLSRLLSRQIKRLEKAPSWNTKYGTKKTSSPRFLPCYSSFHFSLLVCGLWQPQRRRWRKPSQVSSFHGGPCWLNYKL